MHVPEFDAADRCRKAREHAELTQEELADRIEVARSTVSAYESGATLRPRRIVLRQWALACGVDPEWLIAGGATGRSPHLAPDQHRRAA
jgi:transcriptional regulator with XRE-family HTH domain